MSLKIIKFEPGLARIVLIAAAILCVATTWYFVKWNFANAIAARLDTKRPELKPVADWLTQTAPGDPQTHLTAASIFEKTFDPGDLARSLNEYETSAALSPGNYMAWLDLGKARSFSGDADGSMAAYQRALELAPNYAAVEWAYGNSLIRNGQANQGFALIAKAAASNPDYSKPAAVIALQIFDGDITAVRRGLGDTDVTNAALAAVLAGETQFDDSFDAWSKLPAGEKAAKFKPLGESLAGQLTAAKKFQLAARIIADLDPDDGEKPDIGQITNGGFENGVKLRSAGLFEWQIAEGAQPQIGLGEGQSHGGQYSLSIMFNSFETAAFRTVSQMVAVAPGAQYEFEAFYRSDVKTPASLTWEIADAATTATIASTPPMAPAADWTPVRVRFTAPAGIDGVIVRLARGGCTGPSCPMTGKLSLDDLSLRRL